MYERLIHGREVITVANCFVSAGVRKFLCGMIFLRIRVLALVFKMARRIAVQFSPRCNSWTALFEFEACGEAAAESNALFGGLKKAVKGELQVLAGGVCAEPKILVPKKATSSGNSNVLEIFDKRFSTRWSTEATTDSDDLNNGKITLRFQGDQKVSKVHLAFFDGDLARPHFAMYKQSASAATWTKVGEYIGEKISTMQTFEIEESGVNKLYIVGHGNDVGDFTKVSEVEISGC